MASSNLFLEIAFDMLSAKFLPLLGISVKQMKMPTIVHV